MKYEQVASKDGNEVRVLLLVTRGKQVVALGNTLQYRTMRESDTDDAGRVRGQRHGRRTEARRQLPVTGLHSLRAFEKMGGGGGGGARATPRWG